jgi:hypothetical protein
MSNDNQSAGDRQATGANIVDAIGSAVKDNPLPAALIGMGLVWLFTGGRAPLRAGVGAAASGLSAIGGRLNDQVASAARAVSDTATSAGDAVRSGANSMANAAPTTEGLRSTLSDLFQRQPLLLGAIGLGIGAGVAASIPATETEKGYLGEASAEFQSKALGIASEGAHRATNVASAVATTISNEARVQGLTPDSLKSTVADAGRKIKAVAEQAGEAVQKQMQ